MKRVVLGLAALMLWLSAMAAPFSFVPSGATANLAVTGTSQSLSLPALTAANDQVAFVQAFGLAQYLVTTIGTQTVFARCEGTTPTVSNAMPFLANSQAVISLDRAITACKFIAAGTGSTVYITPGSGE